MRTRLAGLKSSVTPSLTCVVLVLGALAASAVHGTSGSKPEVLPIAELKRVYLACGRAALSGRLDGGGIMQCSIVYEELKRRAFGGDFDKLLAWSRAQPSVRDAGR